MAKYTQFVSPAEQLAIRFKPIQTLRALYFKYNSFDTDPRFYSDHKSQSVKPYILGGFNPLRGTFKDLKDTIKPYKAGYHVVRDLLQPLFGLANMAKGLFDALAAPLIFIAKLVGHAIDKAKGKFSKDDLKQDAAQFLGGLISGASSFIRGFLQFKTMFLNWFIRLPLRGIITLVKGKPSLGDSVSKQAEGLRALVTRPSLAPEEETKLNQGLYALLKKGEKALLRGQATRKGTSKESLNTSYDEICQNPKGGDDQINKLNFLNFFYPNTQKDAEVTKVKAEGLSRYKPA